MGRKAHAFAILSLDQLDRGSFDQESIKIYFECENLSVLVDFNKIIENKKKHFRLS